VNSPWTHSKWARWAVFGCFALLVGIAIGPSVSVAASTAVMRAKQYGNWAISVKGTPTVYVRPIPLRTPVGVANTTIHLAAQQSGEGGQAIYTVPSDMWLMITEATVVVNDPNGTLGYQANLSADGAGGYTRAIMFTHCGQYWQGELPAQSEFWAGPGEQVHFTVYRAESGSARDLQVDVNGYLVNSP
jgi:hypothetical protein